MTRHCSGERPGFVNRITLVELAWVLRRAYGYERGLIADTLESLLGAPEFDVEDGGAVCGAIERYRENNVDFSDALMGVLNRLHGCASTATFDKKAAELPEFELL